MGKRTISEYFLRRSGTALKRINLFPLNRVESMNQAFFGLAIHYIEVLKV